MRDRRGKRDEGREVRALNRMARGRAAILAADELEDVDAGADRARERRRRDAQGCAHKGFPVGCAACVRDGLTYA